MTMMQNVLDQLRRQIPAKPPPNIPHTGEQAGQTSGRNRKVIQQDVSKYVMLMKDIGTQRFFGGIYPFAGDAWITKLENNFIATRCDDEVKKDITVYYLEGDAHNWWMNVEQAYGDKEITSEIIRHGFVRKYFSTSDVGKVFTNNTTASARQRSCSTKSLSNLKDYVATQFQLSDR